MSNHEILTLTESQTKHEILSVINELNSEKLKKLGYKRVEVNGLPSEIYSKDYFIIISLKKYYEGVSPEEYQRDKQLKENSDLQFLDVNHPLNTPIRYIRAQAAFESTLFPKNLGFPVFEYRGVFGVKTKDDKKFGYIFGSVLDSLLKTDGFGLESRNVYGSSTNFAFFQTKETLLDVGTVDITVNDFVDYLEKLKDHLKTKEVINEIKNGKSIINGYYSNDQELELINLISQIELMASGEFLEHLGKDPSLYTHFL